MPNSYNVKFHIVSDTLLECHIDKLPRENKFDIVQCARMPNSQNALMPEKQNDILPNSQQNIFVLLKRQFTGMTECQIARMAE